jgi:hypothetical protein
MMVERQHADSLEKIFYLQGFLSSLESITLEKLNSQYPNVNDLVQQLLVTNNNMMSLTSLPCLF